MYKKITFKNGLRVITVPMKGIQSVTVLVLVGTGSKYETKEINGLSHFVEHMLFKGTKKRGNALEVADTLDKVGGVYNAFTSQELTGYWAKVDVRHLDLALDWISDIFLNSKLEEKEIKKEKGVIIEEINMYLDEPRVYLSFLWGELLYKDQPAGWPVIGSKENILKFKRKDFVKYLKDHYSSKNTVVCLAGNINSSVVEKKVRQYFEKINCGSIKDKAAVVEKQKSPQSLIYFKKTDQTHLALGVRGVGINDPRKYAQDLLSTILGGYMSSRLFTEIREKRGLAYYVKTASENDTQTGYLVTQAGIDSRNTEKVISLILKEYSRIRNIKVSLEELKKAKENLKGTLALSLESSSAQASFYAGQELLIDRVLDINQEYANIDKVGINDIYDN